MSWRALLPALAIASAAAADVPGERVAALPMAMGLKPGNWRTETRLVSMDILAEGAAPGASEHARSLRKQVGETDVDNDCIGGRRPSPSYVLFPGLRLKDECTFAEASAAEGRLHLKAHCKRAEGGEVDLAVDGSYSATSMESAADLEAALPGGARVRMTVRMTARHGGECRGPEVIYFHG